MTRSFIAFTGHDCVAQAAIAAARMQQAISTLTSIKVPGGSVRLRQSIGVHFGDLQLYQWHGSWSEAIPLGSAVSAVLRCESAANPGQVLVSPQASARIDARFLSPQTNGDAALRFGTALARSGKGTRPTSSGRPDGTDIHGLSPAVARAVVDGSTPEHRAAAIGFISVHGTDALASNVGALSALIDPILDASTEPAKTWE